MASDQTDEVGGVGDDRPPQPAALSDPAARLSPFEWYREMRTDSPVRFDAHRRAWDVFRYESVEEILRDPETFSSDRVPDAEEGESSMLSSDPPRHTRLRDAVEDRFAPGEVADLEPEIERMAAELVDDAVAGESTGDGRPTMDVVDDLARRLPMITIAALLGVPPGKRETFEEWSDTIVAGPQLTGGDVDRLQQRQDAAVEEMADYFLEVMAERAEDPRDDLVSDLVQQHGETLTEDDIRGLLILLLIAGNVTTTNLVTNAVWCFANQDVDPAVLRDEDCLETAIEEVLRYRSPVQWTDRIATEPVEIEGHEIDRGDVVRAWIGSANRDPEIFDDPETFVPDRSPNPHVAFGRGIHFCLGAALARLEATVALSTLYDRIESVRLVETDYRVVASPFLYGVQALPIEFERRDAGGPTA